MGTEDQAAKRGEYSTWKSPASTNFNKWLGLILDSERLLNSMTTEELARRSGVPKRALYRILAGEKEISIKELFMLSPALRRPAVELWDEAERRMAIAERNAAESVDGGQSRALPQRRGGNPRPFTTPGNGHMASG